MQRRVGSQETSDVTRVGGRKRPYYGAVPSRRQLRSCRCDAAERPSDLCQGRPRPCKACRKPASIIGSFGRRTRRRAGDVPVQHGLFWRRESQFREIPACKPGPDKVEVAATPCSLPAQGSAAFGRFLPDGDDCRRIRTHVPFSGGRQQAEVEPLVGFRPPPAAGRALPHGLAGAVRASRRASTAAHKGASRRPPRLDPGSPLAALPAPPKRVAGVDTHQVVATQLRAVWRIRSAVGKCRSQNMAEAAPRLTASSPNAPVPANKSTACFPFTSGPSRLKIASRTLLHGPQHIAR